MTLYWGIVGAGKICHDFVCALKSLKETDHFIQAVAARDLNRALQFSQRFSIPDAYGDYAEIAKNEKINAVYIGVINTEHFQLVKLMLEMGKNVLCEKPLCLNANETLHLIKLAKEKNCFFMEAIWSRCFPVYKEIKKILDSNTIGNIETVTANLGFNISDVERIKNKQLGGGALLDLGIYVLQFSQFVFGNKTPLTIEATGKLNEDKVDIICNIILTYENNAKAILCANAEKELDNVATIVGSKGTIKIPHFWCPESIVDHDGNILSFPIPTGKYELNFFNSMGLSYEATEVRDCILKGLTESPTLTLEETLRLAQLRDEIRRKIGVFYNVDDI